MILSLLACLSTDTPVDGSSTSDLDELTEDTTDDAGREPTTDESDDEAPVTADVTEIVLAEVRSVQTSVNVTWTSTAPETSWLEVTQDGVTHELWPAGLELQAWILAPELTELTITAVTERDGMLERSEPVTVATGALPDGLDLDPGSGNEQATVNERALLTTWDAGSPRTALLNPAGEIVWYRIGNEGRTTMAARLMESGEGIVLSDFALDRTGDELESMDANQVVYVDWGGAMTRSLATPGGHHFFDLQPSDSVVWLQAAPTSVSGVEGTVVFDALVDSDRGELFHTDAVDFYEGHCGGSIGYYGAACDAHHTNSVDCDLDAGRCIASLHATNQVVEIDATTGELLHDFSTWTHELPDSLDTAFNGAHDVQYVDGGNALLVFNTAEGRGSWAARYEIDRQSKALTASWTHGDEACLYAGAAGGVQPLPNGHYLVNYGSPSGILQEVAADGEVVWSASGSGWTEDEACMITYDVNEQWTLGETRSYSLGALAGVLVL